MADVGRLRRFEPALVGPGLCAWGFLVAKLSALLVDGSGSDRSLLLLSFVSGFAADASIVLALSLAAALAMRRSRAVELLCGAAGVVLGVYAVANVYFVAAYGSPVTMNMLAYRREAMGALWARGPFIAAAIAGVVFLAGAWPAARWWTRVWTGTSAETSAGIAAGATRDPSTRMWLNWWTRARRGPLLTFLCLLVVVGATASALDGDGRLRALGLDRNAVFVLIDSIRPAPDAAVTDGSLRFDASWSRPPDAKFVAPVAVDLSRGRPRHVVIWLAESTGARHTSLGGGAPELTPRLEEFRGHTLRFEHYSANAPVSAKAIFGTLCGLYPLPEAAFESRVRPRIACPSLMETLTAQGYDAALFHGGYFAFTDKLAFLEDRGFSLLLDGESVPNRDRWFTNGWGVDDAAMVDEGLQWLDARGERNRPSLVVFIPLFPHYEYFLPPDAPRPFGEDTMLHRYQNGVRYSDALFGKVVDEYAKRGILDDTLFVFLGDHGEAFEEHPRNKLHAGFLYEENVQAPLVFLSSRLFPTEQISSRLGSHVDLAPTVLSLLGLSVPAGLQGQSLVAEDYAYRPVFLGTWYPDPLLGLRDGNRKYILDVRSGREELYDLARDPGETRNLAAFSQNVTRTYRARLRDWEARQRTFIREHPQKGPEFLDQAFAHLEATVLLPNGSTVACVRAGETRTSCGDTGAWLDIARERAFNMERRCLRARLPAEGTLVATASTVSAMRTAGVALTDRSRAGGGPPVTARFDVEGQAPFELTVDSTFEGSSRARALRPGLGGGSSVRISLESAAPRGRTLCLALSGT